MTPPPRAWMDHAACATPAHRELPWLDDTDALPPVLVDLMADVCNRCPVLDACAAYAAATAVTGGFWAGSDRNTYAALVQLDLDDLLEPGDLLGGAA